MNLTGRDKTNGNSLSHEPLRHKVTLGVSLFLACVVGTVIGRYASDRDPPATLISSVSKTPIVKAGSDFRVEYVMLRHRSCKTHVDRFLFDGDNVRHVLPAFDFAPGLRLGRDQYTVKVDVPEGAAAGTARYSVVSTYICNPLQEFYPIIGDQRDISFEIR